MKIAIRKGRVVDPATSFDKQADLFIAAGKLSALAPRPLTGTATAKSMPTVASSHRGWSTLRYTSSAARWRPKSLPPRPVALPAWSARRTPTRCLTNRASWTCCDCGRNHFMPPTCTRWVR